MVAGGSVARAPLIAEDYLIDCFRLARKIWDDAYRPDFLIALWRGGAAPGLVIQEYFRWRGHDLYHTAIRTQSLEGVLFGGGFDIKGFEHVIDEISSEDRVLIVDDLFETGRTVYEVSEHLRRNARCDMPELRVATVYFRPSCRRFLVGPHYRLHETDERPIFPHSFTEMAPDEIRSADPELHRLLFGGGEAARPVRRRRRGELD